MCKKLICLFRCSYFIERSTLSAEPVQPGQPSFTWEQLPYENGLASGRINWMPLETYAGSHFYTKYRLKGDTEWTRTDDILEDDYVIVRNLQPDEDYEFAVVSVDGEYATDSQVREISTSGIGTLPFIVFCVIFR